MKRRSFVKLLATTVCAVAAGIEIGLSESCRTAVAFAPKRLAINPEWVNAKYEVEFLFSPDTFTRLHTVVTSGPEYDFALGPNDFPRYSLSDEEIERLDREDWLEYQRDNDAA